MTWVFLLVFFGIRYQTGEYPIIPFLAICAIFAVRYLYYSADALKRMADRT